MKSVLFLTSVLAAAAAPSAWAQGKDCTNTSEGLVPLNDLGPGTYLGQQGGLYPGGVNLRPVAHSDAGSALANAVRPLDGDGNHDPVNGKIVLMSVGLSNTAQEWAQFMVDAAAQPDLNPQLVLFNGAQGGIGLEEMLAFNAQYWLDLLDRLELAGLSRFQVQAIWLKTAYEQMPTTLFPQHAQQQAKDLARVANNLNGRFPNARLCYVTSRIYGGYSTTPQRNEPESYENGFGFKWLVQGQLLGSPQLNFDPARGPVRAPWLSWGPYMWADGLVPRSDGLIWECGDFRDDDGHHPGPGARAKMSAALLDFFRNDATTAPWFLVP